MRKQVFRIAGVACLLVLALILVVNGACTRPDPANLAELGIVLPGGPAVDFTLKDVNGDHHTLSQLYAEQPVVMVFGSIT